jgi:hypothetical protein
VDVVGFLSFPQKLHFVRILLAIVAYQSEFTDKLLFQRRPNNLRFNGVRTDYHQAPTILTYLRQHAMLQGSAKAPKAVVYSLWGDLWVVYKVALYFKCLRHNPPRRIIR